jgi:hypothetical protein
MLLTILYLALSALHVACVLLSVLVLTLIFANMASGGDAVVVVFWAVVFCCFFVGCGLVGMPIGAAVISAHDRTTANPVFPCAFGDPAETEKINVGVTHSTVEILVPCERPSAKNASMTERFWVNVKYPPEPSDINLKTEAQCKQYLQDVYKRNLGTYVDCSSSSSRGASKTDPCIGWTRAVGLAWSIAGIFFGVLFWVLFCCGGCYLWAKSQQQNVSVRQVFNDMV